MLLLLNRHYRAAEIRTPLGWASSIAALRAEVAVVLQRYTTKKKIVGFHLVSDTNDETKGWKEAQTRTPWHSSHSPAFNACRWRRLRTTSSNANGTPAFAAGSISNSALIVDGSTLRVGSYREIIW
jgi:hypothetical protein